MQCSNPNFLSYNYLLGYGPLFFTYSTILRLISKIIDQFVKENKYLIIFGSANGMHYNDNSKYLFQWINSNKNNTQCVCGIHYKISMPSCGQA